MTKLYRMPDLPLDYIRYFNDDPDYIVLKDKDFIDRYFIKRINYKNANVEPLLETAELQLDGFNNHRRVFVDDCEEYLYLNAPYLNEHTDMIETLKNYKIQDILKTYKDLFNNLKVAHEHSLNPYDIKFTNYLISKDGKAIFTDFDFIVYGGKPSRKNVNEAIFNVKDFGITNEIGNEDALNTSDKLLAFHMLLSSLTYNYDFIQGSTINRLQILYHQFLEKYNIDSETKKYLDDLISKHLAPSNEDYFIDTVIDPLLDKGLELKKTAQ